MKEAKYKILLIEERKCALLIYGEWMEDGHKRRGLICRVYCLGGLYVRCDPRTGAPLDTNSSLEELKKKLTGHA
ncbi:hypothetical protein KDV29_21440 [Atlantibacter hermannii]